MLKYKGKHSRKRMETILKNILRTVKTVEYISMKGNRTMSISSSGKPKGLCNNNNNNKNTNNNNNSNQ